MTAPEIAFQRASVNWMTS